MIESRSPLSPASRLLGLKLLTLDPDKGTIRAEFAAVPDFINPIGSIQGGIITAMLDDAMGPVATAFLRGHYMAPTLDLKTQLALDHFQVDRLVFSA
jgi:acyl-coenzyme A thioesterase PaaI-like protein